MGSKMYPPGTNHFNPDSLLFKPEQRELLLCLSRMMAYGHARQLDHYFEHLTCLHVGMSHLRRA
jgi:hypothetical protein